VQLPPDGQISDFLSRAWIASRSRSSGARLRDPVARNDGDAYLAFADFRFRK